MEHPRDSVLEAYVIGALDATDNEAFVAHVSACDACAAKLQAEAAGELALMEVHATARRPAPAVASLRRGRPSAGIALAFAAAAAFFLLARGHERGAGPAPMTMTVTAPAAAAPIPLVTCPDGADQAACVEAAHERGLYVAYPPWAAAPRFGGGAGRGPNRSPFGDEQM